MNKIIVHYGIPFAVCGSASALSSLVSDRVTCKDCLRVTDNVKAMVKALRPAP